MDRNTMHHSNHHTRRILGAALMMTSVGLVGVTSLGGGIASAAECTTETYSWTNPNLAQIATWNPSMATGISIPAPAAGVTLTAVSTSYIAYDSLGDSESEITREVQNETGEQFTLRVGGTQVGGLSADLPDTVAQGAASPYFSGTIGGSLGGAGTSLSGGAMVIHHSGKSETPNAFSVKSLTLVVERCIPDETTTTAPETTEPTTTAPGTTAPATTAPATTAPGASTTAPAAPTTSDVAAGGPTTTAASGGGGTVTTVPGGSLPVTGGDMTFPLILAGLAAGTGAALLMVRRKAAPNA